MLNLPSLSQQANLDANRVLFEISRQYTLCVAQISKLLNLEKSYVTNLLNRLESAGVITRISVPSPFPEDFSYFYASGADLKFVNSRIRQDQRAWRSVFPRYATEVHDSLLRHVYTIMRKFGFRGVQKDKTLLSKINQGRADFDIVLESKFQKCRLIVEIKNRNTVPATAAEVQRFGERIKNFPAYHAIFISRGFAGDALSLCMKYGIRPIDIGVQPLTPHLLRKLMKIPHYQSQTINGNPLNPSIETFYGEKVVQWRLEDFLCSVAPERTVEWFIKHFRDKWRILYPRSVKFQANLSLYNDEL